MMGPLAGADARAYRHPPAAARTVPTAARIRMNVKRKGRDTRTTSWLMAISHLLFQLLYDLLRLSGLRRRGIDRDDLFQCLDGGVLVAFVERHQGQLEQRLAPRWILVRRLLIRRRRFIGLTLREFHLAAV